MKLRSLLAAALLTAFALPAAAETYTIDSSHSQARFTYSHFGFSNIVGIFIVEGELVYDPENPAASSITARIPIASLLTGVEKLDTHLKADDFFDVAAFPFATFNSTSVEPQGEGRLKVTGDLVIRAASQPVTLDVTLNKMGPHPMNQVPTIGFDGRTQINRAEMDVGKYAPAISETVGIEITIEANQKKS